VLFFLQKLEVVNEYLMTVDTAADNGGDVANLVQGVTLYCYLLFSGV